MYIPRSIKTRWQRKGQPLQEQKQKLLSSISESGHGFDRFSCTLSYFSASGAGGGSSSSSSTSKSNNETKIVIIK
jgi:hypothetical protein